MPHGTMYSNYWTVMHDSTSASTLSAAVTAAAISDMVADVDIPSRIGGDPFQISTSVLLATRGEECECFVGDTTSVLLATRGEECECFVGDAFYRNFSSTL